MLFRVLVYFLSFLYVPGTVRDISEQSSPSGVPSIRPNIREFRVRGSEISRK